MDRAFQLKWKLEHIFPQICFLPLLCLSSTTQCATQINKKGRENRTSIERIFGSRALFWDDRASIFKLDEHKNTKKFQAQLFFKKELLSGIMKRMQLKKSHSFGQVTVEYILLLIVIVIIVKLVATPMGKIFAKWTETLIGPYTGSQGYYGCLMEAGSLPGGAACTNPAFTFNLAAFGGGRPGGMYYGGTTYMGGLYGGGGGSGGGSDGSGGGSGGSGGGSGGSGGGSDGSGGGSDGSGSGSDGSGSGSDGSGGSGGSGGRDSRFAANSQGQGGSGSFSGSNGGGIGGDEAGIGAGSGSSSRGNKKVGSQSANRGGEGDLGEGDQEEYQFQMGSGGRQMYRKRRRRHRIKRGKAFRGRRITQKKIRERQSSFIVAENSISKKANSSGEDNKSQKLLLRDTDNASKIDESMEKADYGKILKYFIFVAIIVAAIIIIMFQILEFQNAD